MLKRLFFLIIFCAIILLPPVWSRLTDLAVILQSLDIQIIINYIHSFGNFAPLISFVLMTFCIITPFPSFLITFSNAALYGWVNGAILSWSGAMAGALLCFFFARYFGREAVEKFIPQQALKKADTFFIVHGKYAVLIARLLPFLSFSLVSYCAGLTSMTTISYLIATGLGQLPATIIYSYVGKMFTIDVYHLLFALLCLCLFSVTAYFAKKYYIFRKQKKCSTESSYASLPRLKKNSVIRYQTLSSSTFLTGIHTHNEGVYRATAFMPGCALCSQSPMLIEKIYAHLSLHLPGIALLQHCCATPIRSIHDAALFQSFYTKLEDELAQHKITNVITACANCYITIKKYSPKITVHSIYTVLNTLPLVSKDYSNMPKAALHDPCPTRKESEIHESVRELLKKIAYPFEEFDLNKDTTICCGSGQMQTIFNPQKALTLAQKRCSQTNCKYIISYCQSCVSMLSNGGKQCFHILELLFTKDITSHIKQQKQSSIKSWLNRYKVKRITVVKKKNR